MAQLADRIATPILTICALVVTLVVVRREFLPVERSAGPIVKEIDDWRKYAAGGSIMGPPLAPVVIVEFSDFQCPFCAQLAVRLDSLRLKYGDRIAVVYRNFPISSLHPHAREAARASICADRQAAFKAFHDRLLQSQAAIGSVPWTEIAADAGIADTGAFRACLASSLPDEFLRRDSLAASALDIGGTPLLLLNGTLISGAPQFVLLDSLTREALAKAGRFR